jgi:urease accessory protein
VSVQPCGVEPGWRASLELRFHSLEGRTRIAHRRHSGPLVVQRAFHPEAAQPAAEAAPPSSGAALSPAAPLLPGAAPWSEPCHVYVIHPPGGLASGDRLALHAAVGRGGHALLTTPAAGKFYRRAAPGAAHLAQTLRAHDAVLEWLPQENIFYPDAAADVASIVHLTGTARFIGWEISCFGWPASARTLGNGAVRQRFELWLDERPLLLERVSVGAAALSAAWGLAGHPAAGTWLGFPAGAAELAAARAATGLGCAGLRIACTLVDQVLICRALASRADHLKQAFIGLWHAVRPAIAGRPAMPPRVWAT